MALEQEVYPSELIMNTFREVGIAYTIGETASKLDGRLQNASMLVFRNPDRLIIRMVNYDNEATSIHISGAEYKLLMGTGFENLRLKYSRKKDVVYSVVRRCLEEYQSINEFSFIKGTVE